MSEYRYETTGGPPDVQWIITPRSVTLVQKGWQCPCCMMVYSPSVERCLCQVSQEVRLGLTSAPLYEVRQQPATSTSSSDRPTGP